MSSNANSAPSLGDDDGSEIPSLERRSLAAEAPIPSPLAAVGRDSRTVFEKTLSRWRRACLADVFQCACRQLLPLLGPLPQLLPFRRHIFDTLVSSMTTEAVTSLEPVLELLTALSQDLQDMFLEFLPEVVQQFSKLSVQLPSQQNLLFDAFSEILRHVRKHLTPRIEEALISVLHPLIAHPDPIVRKLACQSVAVVPRRLGKRSLKRGVRSLLLAFCLYHEDPAAVQGYSAVVAYACLYNETYLYTATSEILDLIFQGDLLKKRDDDQGHVSGMTSLLDDVTDEALTELYIQFVKRILDPHFLAYVTPVRLTDLWKLLFPVMEVTLSDLHRAMMADDETDAINYMRELSLQVSAASLFFSYREGNLIQGVNPLMQLLDRLSLDSVAAEISRLALKPPGVLAREVTWLMIHGLQLRKRLGRDPAWTICSAKLQNYAFMIRHLPGADLLAVSKEVARDPDTLLALRRLVLCCLMKSLMQSEIEPAEELTAWVLMRSIFSTLSVADGVLERGLVFGEVDFLPWLRELAMMWPDDTCTVKYLNLNAAAVYVMGVLILSCLSSLCPYDPAAVLTCTSQMLKALKEMESAAEVLSVGSLELSCLFSHLRVVAVKAEVRQKEQEGRHLPIPQAAEHLRHALNRLALFPDQAANLHCVSSLLTLLKEAVFAARAEDAAATDSDSEDSSEITMFDLSSIMTADEMREWIERLETTLSHPGSQIRCAVLTLLSAFDAELSEQDESDTRVHLFSMLSEIERADFGGMDRKAIRLVESLQAAVLHRQLPSRLDSACFYALMGLLHIPFQPIWKSISAAMSDLLNRHFCDYWPRLVDRVSLLQHSILQNAGEDVRGTAQSVSPAFSFEQIYEEEIINKIAREGAHYATDDVTELICLLEVVAGVESASLSSVLPQWLPLVQRWLQHQPKKHAIADRNHSGQQVLPPSVWSRCCLAFLSSLLGVSSLQGEAFMRSIASLLAEPVLQGVVLKLLEKFDLKFLPPYLSFLQQLTEKGLKHALLHFNLLPKGGSIEMGHRQQLLPLLIHILFPRTSTEKAKRGDAVLSFLSSAEDYELAPLIELCFQPYHPLIQQLPADAEIQSMTADCELFEHCWWYCFLREGTLELWMERVQLPSSATCTECVTLLRMIDSLVFNFGFKLRPFLSFLLAWQIQILSVALDAFRTGGKSESLRMCLRVLSAFFQQFAEACASHNIMTALMPHLQTLSAELIASHTPKEYHFTLIRDQLTASWSRMLPMVEFLQSVITVPSFVQYLSNRQEEGIGLDALSLLLSPVFGLLTSSHLQKKIEGHILVIAGNCLVYAETEHVVLSPALLQRMLECISENVLLALTKGRLAKGNTDLELDLMERILQRHDAPEALRTAAAASLAVFGKFHTRKVAMKALKCTAGLLSKMPNAGEAVFAEEELWHIVSVMAEKTLNFEKREEREKLSEVICALSPALPGMAPVAKVFQSLLSYLPNKMDSIDYDGRLAAFREIPALFWKQDHCAAARLLRNACLFEMKREQDYLLTQAASAALHRMVALGSDHVCNVLNLTDLKTGIVDVLLKSVGSPVLSVRQDHLQLMWSIVSEDRTGAFSWAAPLCEGDQDQDFFHAVAHFQVLQRNRAWLRVLKFLKKPDEAETADVTGSGELEKMSKLLVPLLLQVLFDHQLYKSKPHEHKLGKNSPGRDAALVVTCVNVLHGLASRLSWCSYRRLLIRLISCLRKEQKPQKGMIRGLCSVLDAFHFHTSPSEQPEDDGGSSVRMWEFVSSKAIPVLSDLLLNSKHEKACPPAAVSLAKIYSRDNLTAERELPGLLLKLGGLMLHRRQGVRAHNRDVYTAVAVGLGPQYLQPCLQSLIATIPAKGYSAHVLDHAIHDVLEAVVREADSTAIDPLVSILMPAVETGLFGEPAEARTVNEIRRRYIEAKTTRFKNVFKLLCQYSTFDKHSQTLMAFVKDKLAVCSVYRSRRCVLDLLDHLVHGVMNNKTAEEAAKLALFRVVVRDGIGQTETLDAGVATAEMTTLEALEGGVEGQKNHTRKKYQYLMTEAALTYLQLFAKKNSQPSQSCLEEADRFVPLLLSCLRGEGGDVSSSAMKCLSAILPLSLPSLKQSASEIGSAVIQLLDSVPNMNHDIAQASLRLLARILHSGNWFQPTAMQVNSLLTLVNVDLEEQSEKQAAFKLIRSILERKIVVAKVYDAMLKLREMMIRSQSAPVRQMASSLFLQFLLSYPQSDRQLQQHVVFVLANLAYEYETGRHQALDMVHQIILKFPLEFLREKHALFYLPLVKRIHQESVPSLKQTTLQVLQALLTRMTDLGIMELIKLNLAWMENRVEGLELVGIQAMSILVEAYPQLFGDFEQAILHFCQMALSRRPVLVQSYEDGSPLDWKTLYCSLHLLEKLYEGRPHVLQGSMQSSLWNEIILLLEFPHAWVRSVSMRLTGQAFLVLETTIHSLLTEEAEEVIGGRTAAQMAFACYRVLESDTTDEKLALLCTKNMVWLAPILHLQSSEVPRKGSEPQREEQSGAPALSLVGAIHRMHKFANLRSESMEMIRITALKFLGALAIRLSNFDCLVQYLSLMLDPIYRLLECKELRSTEERAQVMAQEIMDHMKRLVTTEVFVRAYAGAKSTVEESRAKRKAKEAIQKVTHPERAAKRRLMQNRRTAKRKGPSSISRKTKQQKT